MQLQNLSIIVVLFFGACVSQKQFIGLMGAMEEEIEVVKSSMLDVKEIKIGQLVFYTGKINNRDIVLSLSGIGSVNAAITTTVLINHFNVKSIVFTGVSGAITNNLKVGDIVIGTNFIHYDVDHTIFGLELGHISREDIWKYPTDLQLINLAQNITKTLCINQQVVLGKIISGDIFMKDKASRFNVAQKFQADAMDMESASVAHVAYKFNIPVVIIRSMSNRKEGDDKEQYLQFFKEAAKNSANVLINMINFVEFPY